MRCRACKKDLKGLKIGLLNLYHCDNSTCHFYGFLAFNVDGI